MKELTVASLQIANLNWLDRYWVLKRLPKDVRKQLKVELKSIPKGQVKQKALIEKLRAEAAMPDYLSKAELSTDSKNFLLSVLNNKNTRKATRQLIEDSLIELRELK